jgi:hypothetical protein
VLVPRAPRLLAPALAEVLLRAPMRFGDPGPSLACTAPAPPAGGGGPAGGLVLHAGLAGRALALRLEEPAAFAALWLALEPIAARLAQAGLESA